MYGADWIKDYSDRRYHFENDNVLHSMVNFTDEEAKAIVDEAHRIGKKVAAHAIGSDGIAAALRAGVDTIEHGDEIGRASCRGRGEMMDGDGTCSEEQRR